MAWGGGGAWHGGGWLNKTETGNELENCSRISRLLLLSLFRNAQHGFIEWVGGIPLIELTKLQNAGLCGWWAVKSAQRISKVTQRIIDEIIMAISISKRCFLTSERVAKVCMCR
jgi:hypothetical protein